MTTSRRRRSMTKKLVASSALVAGALALAFGGAFASFTDTASAGPQSISSGTISLAVGPTNTLSTAATSIVPGDTVTREVDLNSSLATANDAAITLQFAASPSSLLDTDPTNGLQVSIVDCSTAPTGTAPNQTCGGTATAVKFGPAGSTTTTEPLNTLVGAATALNNLNSLVAKKQDYLLVTLTFPSAAPGNMALVPTACSGTVGGTAANENMEGCSSTLTYNFVATQRAGTTE